MQNKIIVSIRIILVILVCLWFILLYNFSAQTGEESSELSEKIVEKILFIKDKLNFKRNNNIQTEEKSDIITNIVKVDKIKKERILKWNKILRKIAHFSIFTLGGFLIYLMYLSFSKNIFFHEGRFLLSIFTGILVAIFDEYHQKFSFGRFPDLRDVFIDSCGTCTGTIFAVITVWILVRIIDYILNRRKLGVKENG